MDNNVLILTSIEYSNVRSQASIIEVIRHRITGKQHGTAETELHKHNIEPTEVEIRERLNKGQRRQLHRIISDA